MASSTRIVDTIDTRPAFTANDAAMFEQRHVALDTQALLATLLTGDLHGRIATVSSFGAESAALLHMIAQIDPATPVVFTDTLHMFPETLAYRDTLVERLGLTEVRVYRPDPVLLAAKDKENERYAYDPDGCCDIRKVEPLARALAPFDAWISGRKGFQGGTRTALPRFEVDASRLKINPLASWDKQALDGYFTAHDLPHHPLEALGYASIGCAPCTSPVRPGEDARAGRWRGFDKVECGIHVPVDQLSSG